MYDSFASNYDILTTDVDYKKRAEYICSLFKRYGKMPTLLLDLACGTGGFSNEFASLGVEVIGVDLSPEMLNVAAANSRNLGLDVLYLCQDAAELDLFGTINGAICCQDSLNHITDFEDLCKVLKRVSLFMEKDGLFIFDLNTLYKHETVLGNNTFVIEIENLYCIWQNEFDPATNYVDIALDFFKETDEGLYERTSEYITERFYSNEEIKKAVEDASMEILGVFEEMTENAPKRDTQRIFYVTRKV